MTTIHSISPDFRAFRSLATIHDIFESDDKRDYTNNALLYQNILKYGLENKFSDGFRFTELANWLMKRNNEFRNYYTDSQAHVPISHRVAQRRQRIQGCLEDLVNIRLVYIKTTVEALKNHDTIPLYDFTTEGYLLMWLIEIMHNDADKDAKAIQQVLNIIDSCKDNRHSYSTVFISKFFHTCNEKGVLRDAIRLLMQDMLTSLNVDNGRDVLLFFLGLRNSLKWILGNSQIFHETLKQLDKDTRRIILFQLKLEIEDYYNGNFKLGTGIKHPSGDLEAHNSVAIPGEEWQLMRFTNIGNYTKVIIPGFCSKCRLERSVAFDIKKYLDTVTSSFKSNPFHIMIGKCTDCRGNVLADCIGLFPTVSHI